jgi:hypothetical protein
MFRSADRFFQTPGYTSEAFGNWLPQCAVLIGSLRPQCLPGDYDFPLYRHEDLVRSLWQNVRPRISEMTWHELRTRARQGIGKRLEFAKYLAGLDVKSKAWEGASGASGNFFFAAADLPRIADLLREHLMAEVEGILAEANEICSHRFRLLGYKSLDYGPEIDWHLDAAHGKKAPLKPWFKVPYLDFSVVGDHKVTWELNRHQHLVKMAKAWVLTNEEKYAVDLTRQWYGWKRANPFPTGINWSSTLEVAFRSLSWLWVRALLQNCAAIEPQFEADLLQALAMNGHHIEKYLSTYFSPNTHLLGEAVALFFIGTLCPQLGAATRWQQFGLNIVLRESERQVRHDGVYFEQSLYYHVYALDFFLHARRLAARNQIEVTPAFDATLGRMLDVLQALSQTGPPEGFGDDDGGRVFDPRRNSSEHLTDPLAIGALLLKRDDLKSSATLTEEAVWLFGEQAISGLAGNFARPKPQTTSFEMGGVYVMASSEYCAQRMVVDGGPMGTGRGGHGHADALNVTVACDGRRWLVDCGTLAYIGSGQERDHFRGTGAHNTLRVDGLDQAMPDGPFGWDSLPEVRAECWVNGTIFSLFMGSHNGYSRLPDPVVHRRIVFHLRGCFWLVRDCAIGRKQHRLETFWHFASDLQVSQRDGFFLIVDPEHRSDGSASLALIPDGGPGWTGELSWDELSPAFGVKQAAPVVRISAEITLPAECAMLIAPLLHGVDRPGELKKLSDRGTDADGVCGYQYEEAGSAHSMIFSTRADSWAFGPWASDAEFLYCNSRDARIRNLILCNGSFAKLDGKPVFSHANKLERVEWLSEAGGVRVTSSEDSARLGFSQSVLTNCDAGL